ncbi:MAG: NADH-quinone oxidoreductase subunit J [Candidatus Marinimicrobia bacterium]|nr:NADH-quinone oxidoreductase subunit J [Candidatus Neomarinimicrobiota bacterium]
MAALGFNLIAAMVIFTAFWVVTTSKLIHAAVALMGTLFGVAGLYVYLYADFLAATQVIIYVGGILVLIIFGVMLTHRVSGIDTLQTNMPNRPAAAVVVFLLFMGLTALLFRTPWHMADAAPVVSTVEIIGAALLTRYLLHFEVASVLLLVALLGAAYLARREDG